VVLGDRKPFTGRPGDRAEPVDLEATRVELKEKYKREISDDDLYAYLMYPQVFDDLIKKVETYGHPRVLSTPAFFYGLKVGEEITVDIEQGKRLIVKLIYVSEPNEEGERTLTFELNGRARECVILDRSIKTATKKRSKADASDKMQVGAPIPAMVSSVSVSVGQKVKQKQKLCVLEAMKMQTTVYALADGVVDSIEVQVGDQVDSKDLLVRLR
jgi:pyruvate carboxylase